jgi:hypothetical protein
VIQEIDYQIRKASGRGEHSLAFTNTGWSLQFTSLVVHELTAAGYNVKLSGASYESPFLTIYVGW